VTGEGLGDIKRYLESVFERQRGAIRAVADGLEESSRRLEAVEKRLKGVEACVDGVGIRQGGIETRLDGIEAHQSTLEAELQAFREEMRRDIAELKAALKGRSHPPQAARSHVPCPAPPVQPISRPCSRRSAPPADGRV
jgi:predicted RNase H-like nuclease (RuvC/YqgF family)